MYKISLNVEKPFHGTFVVHYDNDENNNFRGIFIISKVFNHVELTYFPFHSHHKSNKVIQ